MFRRLLVAASFVIFLGAPSFAGVAKAQGLGDVTLLSLAPSAMNALTQPAAEAPEASLSMQLRRPTLGVNTHRGGTNVMTSMYATTAMMQVLDIHSTLAALKRGAVEANPMMSSVVGNRAAFFATKAAVGAATIYAAHRIAKNNKVAAVLTLAAINSAYAMIVSNNYAIARR